MVLGLLEKEKEVLAGNGFEDEEEKGGGFKSTVKGDDVWVDGKGLVDSRLGR